MTRFIIRWLPFFILLGILAVFKTYSIANRYYPYFLLFMIFSGFMLVIFYKLAIRTDAFNASEKNTSQ